MLSSACVDQDAWAQAETIDDTHTFLNVLFGSSVTARDAHWRETLDGWYSALCRRTSQQLVARLGKQRAMHSIVLLSSSAPFCLRLIVCSGQPW